jgi:DNA-binding NtrC family response regulator
MVPARTQLRVFVVDDHDVIASSLAMILRFQGGFHATSFTDPLEALHASEFDAPDLLITDVVMPNLSGVDLAIQLLDHCPTCKVLLFSGQALTSTMLETTRLRGYDFEFLTKPVHPATLLSSIQRVLDDESAGLPVDLAQSQLPTSILPEETSRISVQAFERC